MRIVVADDSSFFLRLLSEELRNRGFEIAAAVGDGDAALSACRTYRPDALTLDLAMPGLDGVGVLKELRRLMLPTPVVVVSAFSPSHGARAVDALAEGALELVSKPSGGVRIGTFIDELVEKLHLAAVTRRNGVAPHPVAVRPRPRSGGRRTVLVACSTGGPRALAAITPRLPSPLGNGTLIIQHMPSGFTHSLAERLDRDAKLSIREAAAGDVLAPGLALLAPGGKHVRLTDSGAIRLTEEPPIGGLRPRADVTIADAARIYGERLLLVVLTGMGKDALEGAREVSKRGGRILAEAESTCTVYGMPRAVVEARLADEVVELDALPEAIAAEAAA